MKGRHDMDEQRKRKCTTIKSAIKYNTMGFIVIVLSISLSVVFIGMILLSSILLASTCSRVVKPAVIRFNDISEMMDTLTDLVKYPSYFPEGYNFIEDDTRHIEVSITATYEFIGSLDRWNLKRDDFYSYGVNSANNSRNEGDEWHLSIVGLGHYFGENEYFSYDNMTLIDQRDGYVLYFQFSEFYDEWIHAHPHTYSYFYFDNEQEFSFYSIGFTYHKSNGTGGYFCEDIYIYTLEEARMMFESLKTYEEMRLFLQETKK